MICWNNRKWIDQRWRLIRIKFSEIILMWNVSQIRLIFSQLKDSVCVQIHSPLFISSVTLIEPARTVRLFNDDFFVVFIIWPICDRTMENMLHTFMKWFSCVYVEKLGVFFCSNCNFPLNVGRESRRKHRYKKVDRKDNNANKYKQRTS